MTEMTMKEFVKSTVEKAQEVTKSEQKETNDLFE